MPSTLFRALVVAAAAAALPAPPALATAARVEVDNCRTESFGADADCQIVVTGGRYAIRAGSTETGYTSTRVGCNPTGTYDYVEYTGPAPGQNAIIVNLPTGVCSMRVWSAVRGWGEVEKR